MPTRHSRRLAVASALLGGLTAPWNAAAAQDAAYFSPTYAASRGSPYSEIYARTFGPPPLETAAAAPTAEGNIVPEVAPEVVYIIEGGRLLTYSAGDYARGRGDALADSELPSAETGGRLYGAIPPAPDAEGDPIPLLPQHPAR